MPSLRMSFTLGLESADLESILINYVFDFTQRDRKTSLIAL